MKIFFAVLIVGLSSNLFAKEFLYKWSFDGNYYQTNLILDDSEIAKCLAQLRIWQSSSGTFSDGGDKYLRYLRIYPCGQYPKIVAEKLREIGIAKQFDRYQMANFTIAFVTALPYKRDRDNQHYNHFVQTPFESLILGHGDCEDHALILAYFLALFCFDTSLIRIEGSDFSHLAVGITTDSVNRYGSSVRTFVYEGKTFLYTEATPCDNGQCNLRVGECPSEFEVPIVRTFPILPICKLYIP